MKKLSQKNKILLVGAVGLGAAYLLMNKNAEAQTDVGIPPDTVTDEWGTVISEADPRKYYMDSEWTLAMKEVIADYAKETNDSLLAGSLEKDGFKVEPAYLYIQGFLKNNRVIDSVNGGTYVWPAIKKMREELKIFLPK